jgi:DNA (cytosine-5)-methyltransferase 1
MPRYQSVDCFSGAGGLSLGLSWVGFHPIAAFDADPIACETFNANIRRVAIATTLDAIDPATIRENRRKRVDLVCGGPPCQGFSMQRRGSRHDSRNVLVVDFVRFALSISPRLIVIENVPGLLGERGRSQLSAAASLLTDAGYQWVSAVVDAADYGVPQRRLRAIVVAWDPDDAKPFEFPMGLSEPARTVREAIGDLPEPPPDYSEHPRYPNHIRVRMSDRNLERISHVPPGGGRLDIPEDLQLPCHRQSDHRHLDVFGRMEWDKPAPTITAMFDNFTRGRFAHPSADRSITGREGARIQSFPDDFRFTGPKKDVARQIGNAVPPQLAASIGHSLRSCLIG